MIVFECSENCCCCRLWEIDTDFFSKDGQKDVEELSKNMFMVVLELVAQFIMSLREVLINVFFDHVLHKSILWHCLPFVLDS